MATIVSATPTPAIVAAHGGQSAIEVVVLDPTRTFSGTIFDDQGGSLQVQVQIAAENLIFTTDPSKQGQQGYITLVDQTPGGPVGMIGVGSDGLSFTFTSS